MIDWSLLIDPKRSAGIRLATRGIPVSAPNLGSGLGHRQAASFHKHIIDYVTVGALALDQPEFRLSNQNKTLRSCGKQPELTVAG